MTSRRTIEFVTWYDLPGLAVADVDGRHLVRVGPFALPHPGVVNCFLRDAGEPQASVGLAALHEQGHVETLPLAALLSAAVWRSRRRETPWSPARIAADLVTLHVVWEGLAEAWVIGRSGATYRWPAATRAAGFWLAVAAAGLWLIDGLWPRGPSEKARGVAYEV
jgi:hypothetical protein